VKLRADKTDDNPEADQLLEELGNSARSIPYLAVFCSNRPAQPFTLRDVYTKADVLRILAACQGTATSPPAVSSSGRSSSPSAATEASPTAAPASIAPTAARPAAKDQVKASAPAKTKPGADVWQPFDIARFRERRAAGRPVIVDWTADW
jgi:thiol:disulfide interchange protein